MNYIRRSVVLTLAVALIGFGSALTMKAAVGVGAWDALAQTISIITRMPIGNISTIMNCVCVCVQLIILKSKFTIWHYMQIPLSIFLGAIINFVYYGFLADVVIESYYIALALLIAGITIVSLGVAIVMVINLVTMALEGACAEIAKLMNSKMHILRQSVDIICVILVIGIAYLLDITLVAREGTFIGAVIFGPLIGMFMRLIQSTFTKLGLSIEKERL